MHKVGHHEPNLSSLLFLNYSSAKSERPDLYSGFRQDCAAGAYNNIIILISWETRMEITRNGTFKGAPYHWGNETQAQRFADVKAPFANAENQTMSGSPSRPLLDRNSISGARKARSAYGMVYVAVVGVSVVLFLWAM